LLVSGAVFSACMSIAFLISTLLMPLLNDTGNAIAASLFCLVMVLAFLALVLPLWQGRWRMMGKMLSGERPEHREILYYYSTRARYVRAWGHNLLWLLAFGLPVGLFIVALSLVINFIFNAFATMTFGLAAALSGAALLGLAVGAALLLLLSVFTYTALAMAIGNERMPVRSALRMAFVAARRHPLLIVRFWLHSLLWLLYSALTFGLLLLFYFAHRFVLSYFRLSMAICPKGEE